MKTDTVQNKTRKTIYFEKRGFPLFSYFFSFGRNKVAQM